MTAASTWRRYLRQTMYYMAVITLVLFTSPLTYAEGETPPAEEQTTPPAVQTEPTPPPVEDPPATPPPVVTPPATPPVPPSPGPQQPTGPDANSYVLNPETGMYENDKYIWDPVTKQTKPKVPPTYSYNPVTKHWDTIDNVYDPTLGKYVPRAVSVETPPADAIKVDTPEPAASTGAGDIHSSLTQPALTTHSTPEPQSPVSNNTSNGIFDLFYNALISNTIDSTAVTGDALVAMNTLAGSAITGNATAIANIINLLQSSWSTAADTVTTFVGNLMGDMFGDLFIDPGHLGSNGATLPADTTINTTQNSAINNTIKLAAESGDATVTKNTQAGDAQSGNATAVANLINAINSSVASQQSFVGMLNIFGNLNGDILLPPDLINTLLAANAVGALDTSNVTNSEVLGNFINNQTITNNVTASAVSGNSAVDQNTSAGNATTGDATTNVTVLNLTGRQVIGKNALLVFVNVLGKWVGVIVDAPTGSTSAALGSGITENSSLAINATANQAITNNVDVSAVTGDATVSNNTRAGNATSGDASAAVNILNINNSNFSLSDWFGVLFINVFGTWNGSFGVDTEAGEVINPAIPSPPAAFPPASLAVADVQAFRFAPASNGNYTVESTNEGEAALAAAHVLGDTPAASAPQQTQHEKDTKSAQNSNWLFSIIGIVVAASLLGTERVLSTRAKKNA